MISMIPPAEPPLFLQRRPQLGTGVFIAPSADVLGDVTLGDDSSVWYQAVLRGDINRILVGPRSNIQDGAVVHLADDFPAVIGELVTIGHKAVVHACTIHDEVLVGMGAIILDGAVIRKNSLVAAGSVVTPGKDFPPGSMIMGSPAKVVRNLTPEEIKSLEVSADHYVELARSYFPRG